MTDNSTATDEEIAEWEQMSEREPSMFKTILKLIARIRAETAKNSGEVITDEQLERSVDAFDANVGKGFRCAMRAAIATLATPANSSADAIGARETDSPLLAASYYAMSKAMALLDADLGHGPVLNMLAKCRCDIENRRALLQQEGE